MPPPQTEEQASWGVWCTGVAVFTLLCAFFHAVALLMMWTEASKVMPWYPLGVCMSWLCYSGMLFIRRKWAWWICCGAGPLVLIGVWSGLGYGGACLWRAFAQWSGIS